jgi:hypothetical protein
MLIVFLVLQVSLSYVKDKNMQKEIGTLSGPLRQSSLTIMGAVE